MKNPIFQSPFMRLTAQSTEIGIAEPKWAAAYEQFSADLYTVLDSLDDYNASFRQLHLLSAELCGIARQAAPTPKKSYPPPLLFRNPACPAVAATTRPGLQIVRYSKSPGKRRDPYPENRFARSHGIIVRPTASRRVVDGTPSAGRTPSRQHGVLSLYGMAQTAGCETRTATALRGVPETGAAYSGTDGRSYPADQQGRRSTRPLQFAEPLPRLSQQQKCKGTKITDYQTQNLCAYDVAKTGRAKNQNELKWERLAVGKDLFALPAFLATR